MNLEWKCSHFDDVNVHDLYAILRLRSEIFVVEQNCVFLDLDDKDQYCFHLSGWDGKNLVAYARLVPPGVTYEQASVGRVVSSPAYRGQGGGKKLIEEAIINCTLIFGKKAIKIGAQLYLKKFYESFGFQQVGEGYLDDGIPHIYMLKI